MSSTGTVAGLWRFPVKSMQGEKITGAVVGPGGVLGDRSFAVVDVADGAVGTAKVVRPFAQLLGFSAWYSAEPEPGAPLPPAVVRFPDGSVLRSDDENLDVALSEILGREVALRAAPSPARPFVDLAPAHLLTSACLEHLATLDPLATLDVRRFRPTALLDLEGSVEEFVEDGWIGRTVALGPEVELAVSLPTPRCVMTTLAQPDLPREPRALSSITRHHRLEVPGHGVHPCAGVYADVTGAGTVTVGDRWEVFARGDPSASGALRRAGAPERWGTRHRGDHAP